MRWPERFQSVLVLVAAAVGLLLGRRFEVGEVTGQFVLPLLMAMLVGVFLHVGIASLRRARTHARVALASLALNFGWAPLLAWLLGLGLLAAPDLRLGLLMLLVTPCTDWYLVFTAIARGNLGLSSALLPLNLVLQLVLLPVYVLALGGAAVQIEPGLLVASVLLVMVVPASLATTLRWGIIRLRGRSWLERVVLPRTEPAQLGLLLLAIGAMFASQGDALLERPGLPLLLLAPLLIFFGATFLVAQVLANWARFAYPERASLTVVSLARNSPLALAIAVAAFPDRPLIALALVVGPLVELPVLALVAHALRRLAPHGAGLR